MKKVFLDKGFQVITICLIIFTIYICYKAFYMFDKLPLASLEINNFSVTCGPKGTSGKQKFWLKTTGEAGVLSSSHKIENCNLYEGKISNKANVRYLPSNKVIYELFLDNKKVISKDEIYKKRLWSIPLSLLFVFLISYGVYFHIKFLREKLKNKSENK